MSQHIIDLLHASGPRRMLSLDGGGIRGVVTLEILARIEALLRSDYGRNDLVLSDHYHFIGGTSTGAIIACGLSLGMPVAELQRFYLDCATEMFRRTGWRRRAHHLYSAKPLREKMKGVFGADTLLGSERFRSLLLVVTRNAKTDSPWFITNNVNAKYNDASLPDCNLNIPVWQLVRASTAAPIFFAAEEIDLGPNQFVFVDGGMTTYNNPSFLMFLMATLEPYGIRWPTGTDRLLLTSVGTGVTPKLRPTLNRQRMGMWFNLSTAPAALIFAALVEQDVLCRTFGDCLVGPPIDSELGDLKGRTGVLEHKLFRYARYNVELTEQSLSEMGLPLSTKEFERAFRLDAVDSIPLLREIGRRQADAVRVEHLH